MERKADKKANSDDSEQPNMFPFLYQNIVQLVINSSLDADRERKFLFKQLDLLLEKLKVFTNKDFSFNESGDLVLNHTYHLDNLSSGEKQLLILFIEAILQRQQRMVYLADEPELSLHISWQREILSTIQQLNPNSQIIICNRIELLF